MHTGESWFKPHPQVSRWFSFENVCVPFQKKEVIENATNLKRAMSDNDTIFQIMWRHHGLEHIRLHLLPMSTGNWRLQKYPLWSVLKKLRFRFSHRIRAGRNNSKKRTLLFRSQRTYIRTKIVYIPSISLAFLSLKPKFLWGKLKKAKQRLK